MKLYIPEPHDAYGESTVEQIEIIQDRMELVALLMKWKVCYYVDEPNMDEDYVESGRIMEICMDCREPEPHEKNLIQAINKAKEIFPM